MSVSREVLVRDYARFRDGNGYQRPDSDGIMSSDRLIRYTAQYLIALIRHGVLSFGEKERLRGLVDTRAPGGLDNVIGAGVIAAFCDKRIAEELLEYGNKKNEGKNPLGEKIRRLCRRALGCLRASTTHLRWASGAKPGAIERLSWSVTLILYALFPNEDRWIRGALLCVVGRQRSHFTDRAVDFFISRFKLRHPEGLGSVLASYFQDKKHPDSKYLRKEFGLLSSPQ